VAVLINGQDWIIRGLTLGKKTAAERVLAANWSFLKAVVGG
jgi:hypothetical protein